MVHFYELKGKGGNRIWSLKHANRPSIAKRILTAKKMLYTIFFRNSGPLSQIAVQKDDVSGSFYKNMVLKKLPTKMRKVHPRTSLQHVLLLHDNAPALKATTVAQFLKSEEVIVLSYLPCSPDQGVIFFLFTKLKKKQNKKKHLVGDTGPEVHWGLQFTSFL